MYIWKYPIPKVIDEFEIEMPRNARVLCVQIQKGTPCIWVKTSGRDEMEKRKFVIIGTGNPFDAEGLVYIGTWQEWGGMLVWHLFERIG
jgi:hypothetical protein